MQRIVWKGWQGEKLEWQMWKTGATRGGPTVVWKEIFSLKNQKYEPNIVEITHLCIMHGVHTREDMFWLDEGELDTEWEGGSMPWAGRGRMYLEQCSKVGEIGLE
jgi:hypothetical protein